MNRKQQAGFSYVEVAIVVSLLVIVAGISIPQLQRSFSLYRLTSSAELVATELAAGRALAVARNWLYQIDCNPTDGTIQIIDPDDAGNYPRTVKTLNSGITFSSIPGSGSEIRFNPRGDARNGTIVLQNANGNTISVVVSRSGRIEVL